MAKQHRRSKRKTWIVFCDESGNTGTNHIDDTQRYYVLAGWILDEANVETARKSAESVLEPVQLGQSEVKGSDLVKTRGGRERIATLMDQLGKAGALPFFVAAHKRYSLAGRFVDYFLDPLYNPRVWPAWFASKEIKQRFAEDITSLPGQVVDTIQTVLRSGSIEDAERCVCAVRDALRAVGNEALAGKVEGILGHTAPAVEELTAVDGPKSKGISPNYAAFTTMLQMLGRQAKTLGYDLRIVHDETSSFESTFRVGFELLKDLDPKSEVGRLVETVSPGTLPLSAVKDVTFETSNGEALVRAADVLAAALCWMFRGAEGANAPGEEASERVASLILGLLSQESPQLALVVAGETELRAVGARLKAVLKPEDIEATTGR